jgi:glycosyltransferase involved in cell wall biosynthesis
MTIAVSIVVPTCRRPDLLDRCLQCLVRQDFDPKGYEIIIANDKPDAAVQAVVYRWQRVVEHPRIRYIRVCGGRGPAVARNRGWRAARGEIIAFTDDDTQPASEWLIHGWQAMQQDVVAAWGYVRVPLPPDPTDYELNASRLDGAEFVTANCFVQRAALLALGGFDERFTAAWREDSDMYFSLCKLGRVVYAPGAVVVHPIRPAPWGVSISQQRKVLFDALLFKKHPQFYRQKVQAGPRWNYYAAVAMLLLMLVFVVARLPLPFGVAAAVWLGITAHFCWRRLRGTSRAPSHIVEMIVTSAVIPPLSVFWRLAGSLKYKVTFIG